MKPVKALACDIRELGVSVTKIHPCAGLGAERKRDDGQRLRGVGSLCGGTGTLCLGSLALIMQPLFPFFVRSGTWKEYKATLALGGVAGVSKGLLSEPSARASSGGLVTVA